MNCHQHNSKAATAVCRACGRAVCAECMQFSDYREAVCSDVCNQERERAHAMRAAFTVEIDSRLRMYRAQYLVGRCIAAVALFTAVVVIYETVIVRGFSMTVGTGFSVALVAIGVIAEVVTRITKRRADDYRSIAARLEQ